MITLPFAYFKCQEGNLRRSYIGRLTPWGRETCGQCRNTASGGGEDTLSSSSNIAAESLCAAEGWGCNFANGWTDRQTG
jgi:hypothetical protein